MACGFGAGRGGIAGLLTLLDEHWEALEFDLHRYANGTDLLDIYRGTLSFRRLGVLFRGLPPESLTKAAIWDAMSAAERKALPKASGHGPWSGEAMQLARIGDGVEWLVWAKTKAAADGGKPPEPYDRPGVERKCNVVAITPAMRAKWQRIHDSRGAVS